MNTHSGISVFVALDFDGVLHPEGCEPDIQFCHRHRFEEVMRVFPGVQIVISSMWRSDTSLEVLRDLFSPDIAMRIVGVTPYLAKPGPLYLRGTRQREIEAWQAKNAPTSSWLAIDDRSSGFEPRCPHLLLIPEDGVGLQFEHLEELEARLKALTDEVRQSAAPPRRHKPV